MSIFQNDSGKHSHATQTHLLVPSQHTALLSQPAATSNGWHVYTLLTQPTLASCCKTDMILAENRWQ
jgi:hypothetical protein